MSARSDEIHPIRFGSSQIGPGTPVLIIAEIGINHEGSVDICARLIRESARAGADAVKLQSVDADESYAPGTESYSIFKRAALSVEETASMFELARRLGVEPFTTAGDLRTLAWVDQLNPSAHKISSGLLTNTPHIRAAARTGKTLLISTGMATPSDIDLAFESARDAGAQGIGLFQCTSIYPAADGLLNLAVIRWLQLRYGVPAGFSDHSEGVEAAIVSVAAGACMIEKHITLDCSRSSFDHRLSLEPPQFSEMVRGVRRTELMMGKATKQPMPEEERNAPKYQRCLVARQDLPEGHEITPSDVGIMRIAPQDNSLAPNAFDGMIGRTLLRPLARFMPLRESDVS